ncbi:LacI family DNA-binding transcriptional regulator [Salinibacter pepae]|uniref:LacI family DNA-binding transcriptional regulator n=1 Tax=Salinibacter pepae TaxID=3040382 RepID=UPI0021E900BF|nr:LacI family DNA-binding transcriptional regulator [Salinibacter pepae]
MNDSRPEGKSSTIYDVAERAGVAISTVSRVLNDDEDVAESTRERVLEAVEKIGYTRNRAARSLAIQTSKTIAAALPTFTTPFHNELLKGVRDRLEDEDIDLMICDLEWESIRSSLESFLSRGAIEGLIFAGHISDANVINRLKSLSIPVVVIGTKVDGLESFHWDNRSGAHMAVDHLVSIGHDRIFMISSPTENIPSKRREEGFFSALDSKGIEYEKDSVFYGETLKHDGFSEESGYEAMSKILDYDSSVSAIFASSDVHALGAWQKINEEGISVPSDIAIIGYDNIKVSRYAGLSSISQNILQVGFESTNSLLEIMKRSKTETRSNKVEICLIKRKSTAGRD